MSKKLPSITELTACPHCGNDEFYVNMRMSGQSSYNRRFDGRDGADNSHIHDGLNYTEAKTAHCNECHRPVARWDEEAFRNARAQSSNNTK